MIYQSHRGGCYYTPENTMPAFLDAMNQGFDIIETDPVYTKDGKIVLMHDQTINRTCVNADGSEIEKPVVVEECTYEELLCYDAGLRKGEEFRGTKIPLLEELLAAAEGKDIMIALDKRIATDKMEPLFDLIARYNVKVSFSTANLERINTVLERFPDAYINYDGPATEEMLQSVTARVRPERLVVWTYLDKPNFDWLEKTRKVSEENCARIKRYARMGIGNVNNPYDVREALSFEPDIVEV